MGRLEDKGTGLRGGAGRASFRAMSYQGKVENGQIKLPPDAVLPEGAVVTVDVLESKPVTPFAAELLKLSKPRDWPADMALNHDHYIHGTPKK